MPEPKEGADCMICDHYIPNEGCFIRGACLFSTLAGGHRHDGGNANGAGAEPKQESREATPIPREEPKTGAEGNGVKAKDVLGEKGGLAGVDTAETPLHQEEEVVKIVPEKKAKKAKRGRKKKTL